MFAWVGIFNSLFLVLYAVTEASVLMKVCASVFPVGCLVILHRFSSVQYVTRWVEETFGFFISIAFTYDAIRPLVEEFIHYFYFCGSCHHREYALFYFALMLLTTLVGAYFLALCLRKFALSEDTSAQAITSLNFAILRTLSGVCATSFRIFRCH